MFPDSEQAGTMSIPQENNSDVVRVLGMQRRETAEILLIDDDPSFRMLATRYLETAGFTVEVCSSGSAGLAKLRPDDHAAVCLDLGLPGEDGLEVLGAIRERAPDVPVVILTANDSIDSVVAAMQLGSYDYFTKPVDRTKLVTSIRNAAERHSLRARLDELERAAGSARRGIIGVSPAIHSLHNQIDRVAENEVTVAIIGESGAGKELVARAIHDSSERANQPFVALNCAAIAETLQESELFGHERGAFTGANQRRVGRFEQAHGGTLFLDEIAELSMGLQAKLLRALQERVFTRVGGTQEVRSDFRLVTATHKNLADEVAAGRFRADLYYRISVFELSLPPLRERLEDIPLLAHHFTAAFGREGQTLRLAAETLEIFMAYSWPGNVRELQNAIQHAAVVCTDQMIRPSDLPARLRSKSLTAGQPVNAASREAAERPALQEREPAQVAAVDPTDEPDGDIFPTLPAVSLDEIEKHAIGQAIEQNGGNVSAAIRQLGIGRTTLYRKLREYGLR
jgi:DNA-binding NtrC family response regulator